MGGLWHACSVKILVTGGAGFIGSNFLNRHVPEHPEHEFLNLDRLTYAGNLRNLERIADKPNYRFERGDIADREQVQAIVSELEPDAVVHFAAESHVDRSIRGPREFIRTNVEGTFNLLEACRAMHVPPTFHHVSTDEVYGALGDTGRFSENTPYSPNSPYSASKAGSDHLVRAYHHTYGLPVKVTNCSNNYGPYQFPEKLVPLMILNAIAREPLPIYGKGLNVRDWLHVEDHCAAIWQVLLEGRVGETYNVGADCEMRNVDMVDLICRSVADETGASPDELLGLKTEVADRPGHDFRYAVNADKLRSELGWAPRYSLAEGMRQTVRWYLDNDAWVQSVQTGEYRAWIEQQYGVATPASAT